MTYDLATARDRLQIAPGDTTQDAMIQVGLDTALAIAEKYCDRQFLYAAQRARFYHVHGDSLQLRRFPIEQVMSLDPDRKHKVHHISGIIELHGQQYAEEIAVDYAGGYRDLPPDLELALWMLFDSVWGQMSASGAGAAALGAGVVQSISSEGQTVRFFNPTDGGAVAAGIDAESGLPFTAVNLLRPYRLETC